MLSQETSRVTDKTKFNYAGKETGVSTDFDNGSLARVEETETNLFDCWPYDSLEEFKSLHGSFAFHFRLNGCRNKKVRLRFHIIDWEIEKYGSVVYANPDFPVYSYDRKNWTRMEHKSLDNDPTVENGSIVSVEQTFTEDAVWIAYQYPYSNSRLDDYIKEIQDSPFCEIELAGRSTEGRDIRQISITEPAVPLEGKKVIWIIGLQHCAEMGAGWGLEGMIDFLLSQDPPAAEARKKCLFKIIPIVNVDAVSEGRGRIHSSDKNLNREWEKPDPVAETSSTKKTLDAWSRIHSSDKNPNREREKPDPVAEASSIKKTLDEWKAKGNSIDIFLDIHGFSSKDGRWHLVLLPEETYKDKQAAEYKRLTEMIKKHIPSASAGSKPSLGYAAGAGGRQYGALSMAIDGWIYKWLSSEGKAPNLSSRYDSGHEICSLEEIKACGALWAKALVEFSS